MSDEANLVFHNAQDKLTFLLSLVPYLIEVIEVSVSDAARHFAVPEQTIRDAVMLIAVSGVPGSDTMYQHGDLFDIDWEAFENDEIIITQPVAIDDSPRFSSREAAALIAGVQYLQSLPENAGSEVYSTLAAKLTRGSSDAPSQVVVAPAESNATLAAVRGALTAAVHVEFTYRASLGTSERRRVDPLRIDSNDGDWYLRAWCHLRKAVRTFRLDRIDELVVTDEPIDHRASELVLSDSLFDDSGENISVVLEFRPEALALLGEFVPEGTRLSHEAGWSRATIRVAHFHGLKRMLAGLAGVARVIEPTEARAAVASWAHSGAARYPTQDGD